MISSFFFFNDTATTEIYTLPLHDVFRSPLSSSSCFSPAPHRRWPAPPDRPATSEEHTSVLQSHSDVVCRLLLEESWNKTVYYPQVIAHTSDAMRLTEHHAVDTLSYYADI